MSNPTLRIGRTVLVAAFGAALALGVAALVAFEDPEVAARATLERLGLEAESEVRSAWRAQLAREWPCEPRSAVLRRTGDPELGRVATPIPLEGSDREREVPGSSAFETVWGAAHERERLGEIGEALELLEHARTLTELSDEQRVRGLVRTVQWSALERDADAAVASWRALLEEVDGAVTLEGRSVVLVTTLAVLPLLEPTARVREGRAIAELWRRGELAISDAPSRWLRTPDGRWTVERPAAHEYALAVLERSAPEVRVELEPWLAARDARALEARLGPLPAPPNGAWSFHREASSDATAWFALQGRPDGAWQGAFLLERDLLAELERTVAEREALPAGFRLSPGGPDPDVEDEPFGAPLELSLGAGMDGPSVLLRHVGIEALIAGETRRRLIARAALLLGALACAAAGLASARALRREQALADLKTRFVANVSHELRTPLASILLLAENLEAGNASERTRGRYPTLIRREAARLRRLVDDVLDFSRLERGKPLESVREDVALGPWLDALEDELAERAAVHAKTIELQRDLEVDAARIDSDALRRALLNLVDNALLHADCSRVVVRASARPEGCELSVADDGRGLPARDRERCFEPFVRLAEGPGGAGDAAPGTGLGLAIVREIARAHGGDALVRLPEREARTDTPEGRGPGIEFVVGFPLDANGMEER